MKNAINPPIPILPLFFATFSFNHKVDNRAKQIDKFLRTLTSLILITMTSLVFAQESSSQSKGKYLKYEDYYTAEGFKNSGKRGTYSLDPHIWVYTADFSERFGMPKEWIDDSLKGAEAIAFRYDLDVYGSKCGYFGDLEECRPSTACVVDMYISDDANLPWNTETRFDSQYGHKSLYKLKGNTSDKAEYLKRGAQYPNYCYDESGKPKECLRPYEYHMGVDVVGIRYKDSKGAIGHLSTLDIFEYDRDIYTGLDYISGSAQCNLPKQRNLYMEMRKFILNKNGSIAHKKSRKHWEKGNIEHTIYFPNSYMERLEAYSKKAYEPDSLFNRLKQKLKTEK